MLISEMEFHPYLLAHTQPVMDIHSKHQIVTQAYGPLSPILRHPGGPLKPILTKVAERLGTDEANVLLKWTIQKGVVAITTSSNEGRIQKMAGVSKLEDLTDEEMEEIDRVGRGVHFRAYAVSASSLCSREFN
jgi:diketogulonate reductase-like aldo/keto reductase